MQRPFVSLIKLSDKNKQENLPHSPTSGWDTALTISHQASRSDMKMAKLQHHLPNSHLIHKYTFCPFGRQNIVINTWLVKLGYQSLTPEKPNIAVKMLNTSKHLAASRRLPKSHLHLKDAVLKQSYRGIKRMKQQPGCKNKPIIKSLNINHQCISSFKSQNM